MRPRKYPKHLKREASAWTAMHDRCSNPKSSDYPRYGGAGIQVCPAWDTLAQFMIDMGPAPGPKSWLGRRNTAGNYTPGNCLWTTRDEQQRRRQFCQKVTVEDQTITAAEAARLPGMPDRVTVVRRKAGGFSPAPTALKRLDKRFIWITYQGETLPTSEWAKRIGLPDGLVLHRAKAGMSVDRILTPHRFQSYRPRHPKPTNQKETPNE